LPPGERIESVARKSFVLDTSAILTLIEDEAGADRVEEVIQEEQALIPWMALLEVHYVSAQERGKAEADRRYALLKQLPCEVLWQNDEPTLLTAASFKASHRLSLADSVIASCAKGRSAVLLHKDPEFEPLSEQIELEALPYKSGKARH
jgi:predicted nucleic acid-binding protein